MSDESMQGGSDVDLPSHLDLGCKTKIGHDPMGMVVHQCAS